MMLGAKLKDFQFKPRPWLRDQSARLQLRQVPQRGQEPRARDGTGEAIYFIKDLKDPFFRQVYGERSMYLSR